jgi:hypothetical protein
MTVVIQAIIGILLVIWAVANIAKYFTKGHPEITIPEPEPEVIEEKKPIKTKRYYPKKKKSPKTDK